MGKHGSSCWGKGAGDVKLYLVPRTIMRGTVSSLPILLNGGVLSQTEGQLCFFFICYNFAHKLKVWKQANITSFSAQQAAPIILRVWEMRNTINLQKNKYPVSIRDLHWMPHLMDSVNNLKTGLYRVIRNDCRVLTTCHTQYTWDRSM
jgi:hypothetical protein